MRGYPQPPVTTLRFQNPIDRDAVLKLCRTNIAKLYRILQEKNFLLRNRSSRPKICSGRNQASLTHISVATAKSFLLRARMPEGWSVWTSSKSKPPRICRRSRPNRKQKSKPAPSFGASRVMGQLRVERLSFRRNLFKSSTVLDHNKMLPALACCRAGMTG